jgi:hypothetical protein
VANPGVPVTRSPGLDVRGQLVRLAEEATTAPRLGASALVVRHGSRLARPEEATGVAKRVGPDRPSPRSSSSSSPGVSGEQVGSFALEAAVFTGGGRLDQKEEVLEVESGVIQLLITTAPEDEPD